MIAGTLAYMAPEQTGRMNRSVDSRSDLYALGVTFYELLTGALPFTASEPMEWIHCHIARQPVPPERADGRHAGAALGDRDEAARQDRRGALPDRRRASRPICGAAWRNGRRIGRIDPFPLGAHDAPDRLLIPEKLYGREREIDALLAAFDRVVAQRHAGARARIRLFRHRQVLGGQRAAQGARRRRAACSPPASSTSTSATSRTPPWRKPSRAWCARCWARAMRSLAAGATPSARRWARTVSSS